MAEPDAILDPDAEPADVPQPAAEAKFEPGDYVAVNSFWSGKLTFRADGTFSRDNGDKGVWISVWKSLTYGTIGLTTITSFAPAWTAMSTFVVEMMPPSTSSRSCTWTGL